MIHDATLPHHVYRLFAEDGSLLYVGIAVDVERRLAQHRRKPWWSHVTRHALEVHPNRSAAERAEQKAIQTENPAHNLIYSQVNHRAIPPRLAIPVDPRVAGETAPSTTWTGKQCAAEWGVSASTWRAYVAQGRAPQPLPGYDEQRRRRWDPEQVRTWPRPKRGYRTDLHGPYNPDDDQAS